MITKGSDRIYNLEFIECNEQPTQKTETSHNTGNYTGAYITYKTHQTMNHDISQ